MANDTVIITRAEHESLLRKSEILSDRDSLMEGIEDTTIKTTREAVEHLLDKLNEFANGGFQDQKYFLEALETLSLMIEAPN